MFSECKTYNKRTTVRTYKFIKCYSICCSKNKAEKISLKKISLNVTITCSTTVQETFSIKCLSDNVSSPIFTCFIIIYCIYCVTMLLLFLSLITVGIKAFDQTQHGPFQQGGHEALNRSPEYTGQRLNKPDCLKLFKLKETVVKGKRIILTYIAKQCSFTHFFNCIY